MTLTKAQIIESIAELNLFSKKKSAETVETVLECIKSCLESGEDVLISGFVKFCVNVKQERRGRNPATGESIVLPPKKIVTFRCSGKLREKINKGR